MNTQSAELKLSRNARGRVEGKRAIVTGAANGIGKAIATRLAEEGAKVACLDINEAGLEQLKSESGDLSAAFICAPGDVTQATSVEASVAMAVSAMGGLDIVINNVGLSGRGTVETTSEADWDRISLNTKSVFLVSKFAIPHLREAGGGAIVNIGSCTGVHAEANRVAYGTVKAAINMMSKFMALDHGPDNIRVNCINPGVTETSLSQGNRRREAERRGVTFEDVTREIADTYPLGRTGSTLDIANGVLYLVSDEAAWVTGASLSIDGGWSAGEYRKK
jgi:NAD(P)-dependent dehydrogenase (short-subunit alcohol dehydrogenase family)